MALSTATITFNVADILGVPYETRRSIRAWVDTNIENDAVIDTDGNRIRLGSGKVTVADNGTGSVTVWVPGTGSNPASWQTYFHFEYVEAGDHKAGRQTRTFGPYTITTSGDLADLAATIPAPPEIPTAISLSAADARYLKQTDAATTYGRKRPLDPREYGAVCDGVADDTTALQATINAAGSNGVVELPPLAMVISAPLTLPSRTELRGSGAKQSRLMVATDTAAITMSGGEAQAVRNLKIWSTFTGTRTTYDIDVTNPTKVVIEDVEIDLPVAKSGTGGIRFLSSIGGNNFMPQLSRVWIREGSLILDGVTDGHFVDGFVWAADDAVAAIHVKESHLWTFTSVDVVPSDSSGCGYLFENTDGAQIVGGYVDGSYPTNLTGYGLRAINSARLMVTGHHYYANGKSGVRLEDTDACSFTSCGFIGGNKQDNSHPDIDLYNSTGNTFIGTSHGRSAVRVTKGPVYREDATSFNNVIDYASIDTSIGNQYAADPFVGKKNTIGDNNRPRSLWQKHAGAPDLIFPPATLISIGSGATWPTANAAVFHRFTVDRGAPYRYANFRCNTGSGNVQAAVVALSGTGYTDYARVMTSGVIACTSGDKLLDMGTVFLEPGEYALALWCDNTTASFQMLSSTGFTAMRSTAVVTGLASGVPTSGSVGANWGATAAVGGMSLGLTV